MADVLELFWDWTEGSNVDQGNAGDVTLDEYEQVLARNFETRTPSRSNPARWIVGGHTDKGRYLIVVFELEWIDELRAWGVRPVTAYPPRSLDK